MSMVKEVGVRSSALVRIALIGVLIAGLLFPLMMIYGLISERAGRRAQAANEISAQWGAEQTVVGPVLSVAFHNSTTSNDGKPRVFLDRACFLPVVLNIEAEATPEIRKRTLFEVIVYRSRLKLTGRFSPLDLSQFRTQRGDTVPLDVVPGSATLTLGLADPHGIASPIALTWDGKEGRFTPGSPELAIGSAGVSAAVALPDSARDVWFTLSVDVNGTRELRFVPAGNETTVQLTSAWPHPSFVGTPLPKDRQITDAGFTAGWTVPYYGRSFTPSWIVSSTNREAQSAAIGSSSFGVTLMRPIDIYQKSDRAVKYAALFIVMTFVIAFLWEIVYGALVHPVQYLVVGCAMCLFYLLLLALSEHIGFDRAYLVGAAADVALIAWYWNWVIRGGWHGVLMGIVLSALYGYLFMLLRLEDYALLAGAVGLFAMLAAVMFLTRKIDWYELKLGQSSVDSR
jgi:inner membrane protein